MRPLHGASPGKSSNKERKLGMKIAEMKSVFKKITEAKILIMYGDKLPYL